MKDKLNATALVRLAWTLTLLFSSACALTSKADLVPIRYFNPEIIGTARSLKHPAAALELRVGRVVSGVNLRERIAFRKAQYEAGYYEEYRWAERPEVYFRRALARSLFEAHGFRRGLDSNSPTIELELIAFDEVLLDAARTARVQVSYVVSDADGVLLERTSTFESAILDSNSRIEDFVAAMASTMERAIDTVSAEVRTLLAARASNVHAKR